MNIRRLALGTTAPAVLAISTLIATQSDAFADDERREHGTTVHVAHNGIDASGCGGGDSPCRTITRGILNAAEGDTILVQPGRYGDVNADGDFADPGEEGSNEPCTICIRKRVRVISTHGAAATVIDGGPGVRGSSIEGMSLVVVYIGSSGGQFGENGKGFTITGEPPAVRDVDSFGLTWVRGDIRVSGNTFVDTGNVAMDILVSEGRSAYISHNTAIGSVIAITGEEDSRSFVVNNTASGVGGTGFWIRGAGRHVVTDNVSSNNSVGFLVDAGGSQFHRNIATGNRQAGFEVRANEIESPIPGSEPILQGGDNHFVLNTVTGNRGVGFLFGGDPATNILRANNIFGNLGNTVQNQAENCGVLNESGAVQIAKGNYWGAATGPGRDPADKAGPNSGCDIAGETVVVPFATRLFVTK